MSINKKYTLVNWPEVQELMDEPWFNEEAILDNSSDATPSSYFIPTKRIKNEADKIRFIEIVNELQFAWDNISKYYKLGIDLLESESPVVDPLFGIVDKLFKLIYNEKGIEWIDWFIYENDFGRNKLEAYDDDKLICQTVEDLYDYIQEYKI